MSKFFEGLEWLKENHPIISFVLNGYVMILFVIFSAPLVGTVLVKWWSLFI